MTKRETLRERILDPRRVSNVRFDDLVQFLEAEGFKHKHRSGTSHHVFVKKLEKGAVLVNLQRGTDGKAKPYQVKQVIGVFVKRGL